MKTVKTGIRQKANGKFVATKSFKGKRYYAEFSKERDAIKWRKEFHPLASKMKKPLPAPLVQNGADKDITFGEVHSLYQDNFMPSLSTSTAQKKDARLSKFARELSDVPVCLITPEVITNHLKAKKLQVSKDSVRCNFDKELKDLASVFNWYKDNRDFTFINPITRVHSKIGKIREVAPRDKYLSQDEVLLFLDHLPPMYQSMAKLMYLYALRVGEVAALSDDVINLKKKEMYLYNVIEWIKGRPSLKRGDKTGTDATLPITDVIEDEIRFLQHERPQGCKYLFHNKGKILRHAMILKVFNKALSEAGLPYSGTHIMRHSMATEARRSYGLDASQAILRHKSARMSEHYAKLDVGEKVNSIVIEASDLFKKKKTRATKCDQTAVSD